jgi:simple sugar transport system permease protein/ribose transport system permease protein
MSEAPGGAAAAAERASRRPPRPDLRITPFAAFLILAVAVAAFAALTTDGFLTVANLKAILFTGSFVGIAAVGTTVIMLSGNLFSLSLGTTISVGAITFLSCLRYGLAAAIVLTLLLGLAIFAAQGAVVGIFDANPIIVSIAAGAIQTGVVTWLTAGTQVVPSGTGTNWETLGGSVLGIPFGFYALVAFTLITAFLLQRTAIGRAFYLIGENRRAARTAGLRVALITTGAFAVAGLATAAAGIVLGAFNGTATLSIGSTYTYDAVAAALVGGNAIQGGHGSVWRAFFGALFIAGVSDLLLLRGYSTGVQILVEGIAVVVVVVLVQVAARRGR